MSVIDLNSVLMPQLRDQLFHFPHSQGLHLWKNVRIEQWFYREDYVIGRFIDGLIAKHKLTKKPDFFWALVIGNPRRGVLTTLGVAFMKIKAFLEDFSILSKLEDIRRDPDTRQDVRYDDVIGAYNELVKGNKLFKPLREIESSCENFRTVLTTIGQIVQIMIFETVESCLLNGDYPDWYGNEEINEFFALMGKWVTKTEPRYLRLFTTRWDRLKSIAMLELIAVTSLYMSLTVPLCQLLLRARFVEIDHSLMVCQTRLSDKGAAI
jgi:hypothetical protein